MTILLSLDVCLYSKLETTQLSIELRISLCALSREKSKLKFTYNSLRYKEK